MPEATHAATAKPHTLDDVMIAMDVVDTVRHRDDLVRRELNETEREAELIERLREIYRQQGIDVPDGVLAEGVKAIKDSRFTYTSQPASWKRSLYELWTERARVSSIGGVALAALLAAWSVYHLNVTRPAQLAEAQTRIELTETLPKGIRQAHADISKTSTDQSALPRADLLLADGERAIRDKDRAAMARIGGELARLRDEVAAEYTLTIVSRPGETTGVWRRPSRNSQARNYYIIVEPISPDGRKLKIPVRNEETGETSIVERFGVRVPQPTFDNVAADKRDDGIVQKNRFGAKRRGTLTVDYQMPFDGGMITAW